MKHSAPTLPVCRLLIINRPHTPRMKVREKEEALKETPFLEIDDLLWLKSLRSWLSGEEWDLIMIRNPRELYMS